MSALDAVKARDLQRDGRCAIHAHPGKDGDAKVAGVAVEVTGEDVPPQIGDSSRSAARPG
ncbi:hypothetical protein [Streptosporangium pseudovulgare]|uniref:Pyridoxamine 5'-phosphate oxidase putative domain-containing protein n=1 Tax=Streptosporangium pseudovulgare TaxID=35765 RepID=A0ABQ2R1M1_9ACTN|nr:hypothetical protein [Streptosporangium pseudovulgare]GGQ05268.1 hypothetical protein GCM10010140_39330 [Streptosporangium pseudovulgare]